jgi:hypothetical protein
MNRRELIQWLSAGTVGISASVSPDDGVDAEAATAEVKELPQEKAILVFALSYPISEDRTESLKKDIRQFLIEEDIDIPAVLLPHGLSLEVIRYPVAASASVSSVSSKE